MCKITKAFEKSSLYTLRQQLNEKKNEKKNETKIEIYVLYNYLIITSGTKHGDIVIL